MKDLNTLVVGAMYGYLIASERGLHERSINPRAIGTGSFPLRDTTVIEVCGFVSPVNTYQKKQRDRKMRRKGGLC